MERNTGTTHPLSACPRRLCRFPLSSTLGALSFSMKWLKGVSAERIVETAAGGAVGGVLATLLIRALSALGVGLSISILVVLTSAGVLWVGATKGIHRTVLFSSGDYEGVKWKWRWNGTEIDRSSLTPHCQNCGEEIESERIPVKDAFLNRLVDRYDYKCDNEDCEFRVQTRKSRTDVAKRIEREWETGNWWKWWDETS